VAQQGKLKPVPSLSGWTWDLNMEVHIGANFKTVIGSAYRSQWRYLLSSTEEEEVAIAGRESAAEWITYHCKLYDKQSVNGGMVFGLSK
jgi:hypothetical protein